MSLKTITFGNLSVKERRVHLEEVRFDLVRGHPKMTEQFVTCGTQRHGYGFDSDGWGRVYADRDFDFGAQPSGSFFRNPVLGPFIWTRSIFFCPSTLEYDSPDRDLDDDFYKIGKAFVREMFEFDSDPHRNWFDPLLIDTINHGAPESFWSKVEALAEKHRNTPAFVVKRARIPPRPKEYKLATFYSGYGLGTYTNPDGYKNHKRIYRVGPWGFAAHGKSRGFHGPWGMMQTLAGLPVDWVEEDQREAFELKRWLHGYKSKHDSVKEVMRQAVRRRIIKHRATNQDIEFFKTLFGVSQVAKWIVEANKRTQHDNAYAGQN